MSNVAKINPSALSTYDAKSLALIRRTVAADCNDDEFSLFINMARALGLDPLRRQIYALVYSKGNAGKRRMSVITGIDGFRSIADRTGNYRPDEDEPHYESNPEHKGPNNPAGLVKAIVRVFKHSHGAWHKVTASAHWDEFVPLSDEWAFDNETGKRKPTGKQSLDPKSNWFRMPHVMLAKVAEAQALRKAWPDNFAGVYAAEEMDRATILDVTPAEAASEGAMQERREKIGARDGVMFDWGDNHPLEMTPIGQVADKVCALIEANSDEPAFIAMWTERNRAGLREFWAKSPSDALEVKKKIESATASVRGK